MKNIVLLSFFSQMVTFSYSQPQSIQLKTYCFGNYDHRLIQNLTPLSRAELEKVFIQNNIDTSSFYRIKYDEVFTKYTTKDYLSNHSYTYINWYKFGKMSKLNECKKVNGFKSENPNKILVLYSTNNKDIEDLSIYILN
jgi:hypothetical protein